MSHVERVSRGQGPCHWERVVGAGHRRSWSRRPCDWAVLDYGFEQGRQHGAVSPADMCGVRLPHRENNYGGGGGGESDGVTVFVKGFDPSYGSEDEVREALQETFKDCGEIKSIRLPSDREAGTLKGFAYIEFGSTEAKVGWTGSAGGTKRSWTCAWLRSSHKGATPGVTPSQQRMRAPPALGAGKNPGTPSS